MGVVGGAPRETRRRIEHPNHVRFLTFSCYRRMALFSGARIRDAFAEHLAAQRERWGFGLIAWVVMPEHVHVLLWPDVELAPVSTVLRTLKGKFAERVLGRWRELGAPVLERLVAADGRTRFWQDGGGYDRNVFSEKELAEKIAYIHNNPVARGLVTKAEDWTWSSARWYAGVREGQVPIDPVRKPGTYERG